MTNRQPLAEAFPAASESDWQRLADHGETGLTALRWQSEDGLPVGPIYPPSAPRTGDPSRAGRSWTLIEQVPARDPWPAATAEDPGNHGVEILFIPKNASYCRIVHNYNEFFEDWARILPIVSISRRPTWVSAGLATPRLLRDVDDSSIVHAICDPLAEVAIGAPVGAADGCFDEIAKLIRRAGAGLAFTANGCPWHDGGATNVQELAIVLASAVASLRRLAQLEVGPQTAWERLGIRLSADADQFMTIAKFRAVRLLLRRVAEIAGCTGHPIIHAETSWRMLGVREPTMNLVRASTAAFAAATGGADAITVLSPMLDDPRLSARMARNIQLILQDESSLGRTADPGAGAGAVEDLTERMAAEAWGLFKRIESKGGLAAAIASGSIVAAVSAERDRRLDAVARRRLPMVGINVNVDPEAPLPALAAAAQSSPGDLRLRPVRLAEPLERLADAFGHVMAGESVPVIRLGKGGDPDLADALAAVGLKARSVRTAADIPSVPLACIVVGDGGAESAAEAASGLRAAGTALIVAASIAEGTVPDWCDAIVTPDCDLVAVFSGLLDRIAERQEKEQG